jgi:hypothetical protein
MIFWSSKVCQSTSGENSSGFVASSYETFIALSTSMCIGLPQCAQLVSMATEVGLSRSCPCTKGAARASSAQAAYSRSPLLNVRACGVGVTVTGYAQVTLPSSSRTRKNSFASSSSRMLMT